MWEKIDMTASKRNQNSHDINFRGYLTMAELGMGRESMASLCCIIGMPAPSSQTHWDFHNKKLLNELKNVVKEEKRSIFRDFVRTSFMNYV